jgi:REP element-mobilizing transposase RayT
LVKYTVLNLMQLVAMVNTYIFFRSEPKYAPSRVMQIIKSITSRKILEEYPEIRKQLWRANSGVMEGILEL